MVEIFFSFARNADIQSVCADFECIIAVPRDHVFPCKRAGKVEFLANLSDDSGELRFYLSNASLVITKCVGDFAQH